jgi:hypothetical protein
MEHSGVFGVFSAINGSKNGSKFGRGEPFAWADDFDVLKPLMSSGNNAPEAGFEFGLEHKFKKMRRTRCCLLGV